LHYGVAATPGRVQILDLTTRRVIADAPMRFSGGSPRVDIAPDGSVAVALRNQQLLWWRRGERQWQSQPIENNYARTTFSPRGERVLLLDDGKLDVRELASGHRYPLTVAQIWKSQFLDEDQIVAVDVFGEVWRWSLTHVRSRVLADHGGEALMWGFAACDRGNSVVTATSRKDRAIVISSPSGALQRALAKPPDAQIYGLACQGDRVLAGTRDGHLLEWARSTGRSLVDHDVGIPSWLWTIAIAQPPDGTRVDLIGTGQIFGPTQVGGRVVALRDGALTAIFAARFGGNTGIDEIVVSSDGRHAAVVASSGELARIDVASATASRPVVAHAGETRRVRFTDGDRSVVTAGDDGYLRIWKLDDLALQRQIYVGHGRIHDLDVRGTMALVTTSDGHVGEWDLVTQQLVRTYRGYGAQAATARFDVSGRWIVSGDFDGRVCLHRADLEGCYAALVGHQPAAAIRHVRFLDDGQIITAAEDGTVRQWNPPYEASSSDLACELQAYLLDRGPVSDACQQRPGPAHLVR
jgi:WD40 repeat protein